MCCNALQCATVFCSVLQCVAVCCRAFRLLPCCQSLAFRVPSNSWDFCYSLVFAVCCRVLQCVAVCCGVLQCVAVCCGVLRCVAVVSHCLVAVCCSLLQTTPCNTTVTRLLHICNTAATHYITHYIALQHPATQRIADYPHITVPLVRD